MNRIDKLFNTKDRSVLSVYFTAGYPQLEDTPYIIEALETAGADLVEIGFPFSDPVADGPVIQKSSHVALENGMNLDRLFNQLQPLKSSNSIPKILMGYYNTVYQFGVEKFIQRCCDCGMDGVIIPDLPPEVYETDYQHIFIEAGVHFICLVSPQTSPRRAAYLAGLSRGFVYLLSSSSTTGQVLTRLSEFNDPHRFQLPTLIGFGIHDDKSFQQACEYANGAIIGSEFIRHLSQLKDANSRDRRQEEIAQICRKFIEKIKG